MFSSSAWNAVQRRPVLPADRGRYRFRISASAFQSAGKPVTFRVAARATLLTGKNGLVGYFDAPPDKPTVVEFVEYLEPRTTIRSCRTAWRTARRSTRSGPTSTTGRGWRCSGSRSKGRCTTPGRRRATAGSSATCRRSRRRSTTTATACEVVSNNPEADAERILRDFARRAFRRA